MKTRLIALSLAALIVAPAAARFPKLNYKRLNAQAAHKYLSPVRPGYEGRNPYWNAYSTRFLFAPAFDFQAVAGAAEYLYTAKADGKAYTFRAKAPNLSLSPIWNDIPAGTNVDLSVVGLDASGREVGRAGGRSFYRDFPFDGPYAEPRQTYFAAALKALKFIHSIPQVKNWATMHKPDMTLPLNTYPSKTVSGTIRCELMLARLSPADSTEALRIARSAGDWMLSVSFPAGAPLAYFPPTYYGNLYASALNAGKAMSMEACKAAQAYLDLYDATQDERYYKQVVGILNTYHRLQAADGSVSMKLFTETGLGVNNVCARLHPLLGLLRRMREQYGVTDFEQMRRACENWMETYAFAKFEMVAQFEDMSVDDQPYQNLTHWTGVPYAIYVLSGGKPSKKQMRLAREIIDFGEDQFTIWKLGPNGPGYGKWTVPGVEEQFGYRVPIDDSAASMADAFFYLWRATGDKLALAKGLALVNSMVNVQKPNGLISTAWDDGKGGSDRAEDMWISCCMNDILTLLRYSKYAGEPEARKFTAGMAG